MMAKEKLASNARAFFFWLLLYSLAISRTGVDTTTATAAKTQQNRTESHDHITDSQQSNNQPNNSHTDLNCL